MAEKIPAPKDLDTVKFGWCDIHGRGVLRGVWCPECTREEKERQDETQRRWRTTLSTGLTPPSAAVGSAEDLLKEAFEFVEWAPNWPCECGTPHNSRTSCSPCVAKALVARIKARLTRLGG